MTTPDTAATDECSRCVICGVSPTRHGGLCCAHRYDEQPRCAECPEEFADYDLRLRSIDREREEPLNLCTECPEIRVAHWSVWLHTPEWGPGNAGLTRVLCTDHAMQLVGKEARRARA